MAKEFKSACEECCRWDSCCVNDCPLSLIKYEGDPADRENKCTLAKSIRKRIGTKWKLPNLGLKPRELSSMKREAEMSPEKKKERLDRLLKNSSIVRLSEKGYKIAPKSNINRETHGQRAQYSEIEHIELPTLETPDKLLSHSCQAEIEPVDTTQINHSEGHHSFGLNQTKLKVEE